MLVRWSHLAIPFLALVAGTASAHSQVVVAPSAPPAPRVESIPPPPSAGTQVMYWQPGRWEWDGLNWRWSSGHYAQRPSPQVVWRPGHWEQQPSGGYVWIDGRWEG